MPAVDHKRLLQKRLLDLTDCLVIYCLQGHSQASLDRLLALLSDKDKGKEEAALGPSSLNLRRAAKK